MANYCARKPPSTGSVYPVIIAACSDARKTIALATRYDEVYAPAIKGLCGQFYQRSTGNGRPQRLRSARRCQVRPAHRQENGRLNFLVPYSTHFQEIGTRLGPFDIAFVKIGAYGPGDAWTGIHMTPERAVRANREVRAKRMFPVHWSTFNLAYHDWDEPIGRAAAEASRTDVEMVTPRLGEWVDADRAFRSTRWWEGVR